ENKTFGAKFTLNQLDNATGAITVSGGTFYGFNPAEVYTEPDQPESFVAEGYSSVNINDNIYTVVEGIAVSTIAELRTAITSENDSNVITMLPGKYTIDNQIHILKDVTIRGMDGVEITAKSDAANIVAQGATVVLDNLNFEIKNSHAASTNASENSKLIVKDCTFSGKAGIYNDDNAELKVTGCTFKDIDVAIGSSCAWEKMTITDNVFENCKEALGLTKSYLIDNGSDLEQSDIKNTMVKNNSGVNTEMVNFY
ncbi:MAG: hypothetical protein E7228_06420, partial [Clostridiales bacterium]|nr:hypothetical protein [Clostridiales bacterium]